MMSAAADGEVERVLVAIIPGDPDSHHDDQADQLVNGRLCCLKGRVARSVPLVHVDPHQQSQPLHHNGPVRQCGQQPALGVWCSCL